MLIDIHGDETKEFPRFLISRCNWSMVGWEHLSYFDFSRLVMGATLATTLLPYHPHPMLVTASSELRQWQWLD